jgi:hypothetical protein
MECGIAANIVGQDGTRHRIREMSDHPKKKGPGIRSRTRHQ